MFIFFKYLTFALCAIGFAWAFWGIFKHSWLHRKLVGGEWVQKTEHAGNKFGQPVTFWIRVKKSKKVTQSVGESLARMRAGFASTGIKRK